MRVAEILVMLPEAEPVIAQYGLHCFNCSANAYETLDEGCRTHGFTEVDIDDLVTDLNELLAQRPERPQTLTVTLLAAEQLHQIAKQEDKRDQGLLVGVDEFGGFCMEFQEKPAEDTKVFFHADLPSMRLFATILTLQRIGGATIDFREGRFKLDLPEDAKAGACGCSEKSCSCQQHALPRFNNQTIHPPQKIGVPLSLRSPRCPMHGQRSSFDRRRAPRGWCPLRPFCYR